MTQKNKWLLVPFVVDEKIIIMYLGNLPQVFDITITPEEKRHTHTPPVLTEKESSVIIRGVFGFNGTTPALVVSGCMDPRKRIVDVIYSFFDTCRNNWILWEDNALRTGAP
ncbi:hypothetical protein TNIN_325191 [Trichonephila inaurata madagascariensis]|uniref:Uncharacterized protein n=1 Tax=Trichonephila inaurata madagascariensis TaxID=2747483 RepID=A0A8X6Y867_9ARAC|nr:hypothetical protein TNIN_325191 [Trichonephila inaurata madagascariensis]